MTYFSPTRRFLLQLASTNSCQSGSSFSVWFVAVAGELSWFEILNVKLLPLIPLTRFPGFAWMIAAGSSLSKLRNTRSPIITSTPDKARQMPTASRTADTRLDHSDVRGCLIAPIFEEVFFRGVLLSGLRTRLNVHGQSS
jgi:hypothetical protein